MRIAILRWVLAALLVAFLSSHAFAQRNLSVAPAVDKRVALVIGNNDYQHVSRLEKAVNDARAIGKALEQAQFNTKVVLNASRTQMNRAINQFVGDVAGGGIGVLFFAGHGVQLNNQNFLIPVDLQDTQSEADIADQGISLQGLQDKLAEAKSKFSLLVVDACRDNPLPKKAGRALGGTRGLTQASSAEGQMVVFSAGANQQALDKLSNIDTNPNGVFVREFLPWLAKPGVTIRDAVLNVRSAVRARAKTVNHEQFPAIYDQAEGDFYFRPPDGATHVASIAPVPPTPIDSSANDRAFWDSVKDSKSPDEFKAYLDQFPGGLFAALAQARLKALRVTQVATAAPSVQTLAPTSVADSLLVGTDQAKVPIILKFSHVVAENTPKGKGALKFKEFAENRTNGRVKVEVYPNSQLFRDSEEMQMLQLGNVQMLAPAVAKFVPLGLREFEVFDLPYIFNDEKDLHNVTQGHIGAQLFKKLESSGIVGLAYWDNGFKQMSANKPLRTPADFRGQKLRIQSSKVIDGQMRALGATPLVMAFSEVYQALQAGVVDGTENIPTNVYMQKMYEVQKYLTLSNHGAVEYAVIANKKFWNELPADVRSILEGAMRDATVYANNIAKQQNDEALDRMKALGNIQVIALTRDEKNAWKRAVLKVHRDSEDTIGKNLIQQIYKETGFDPNSLQ